MKIGPTYIHIYTVGYENHIYTTKMQSTIDIQFIHDFYIPIHVNMPLFLYAVLFSFFFCFVCRLYSCGLSSSQNSYIIYLCLYIAMYLIHYMRIQIASVCVLNVVYFFVIFSLPSFRFH